MAYSTLSLEAGAGKILGSSVGGKQPKFCTYRECGYILVKFSVPDANLISERWNELL